jgi:hypothetical protein
VALRTAALTDGRRATGSLEGNQILMGGASRIPALSEERRAPAEAIILEGVPFSPILTKREVGPAAQFRRWQIAILFCTSCG